MRVPDEAVPPPQATATSSADATSSDATTSDATAADAAVAAAWRESWGRIVALLVAQYRRPDLAEDAAADAFATATTHWRADGVPTNPGAWLLTAARRRVLDRLRSEAVHQRKAPLMAVDDEMRTLAAAADDPGAHVADEQLRMIFVCCHPSVSADDRVALTLRFVVGLPTGEIARLLLVQESAMAARVTRAKKRLASAGVPFATPPAAELGERLDVVATVIYLAFTSAYQAGPDEVALADEAIRLARLLASLLPGRDVVEALLALMLLQHSRRYARLSSDGELILLPDQDRGLWRSDEIAEGLGLVAGLPAESSTKLALEYRLQALIAAEHARADAPGDTRWARIAWYYQQLEELTGSPVVRLARAVAVAEAIGPRAGLALLEGLDEALPRHHRLPAVRAELLIRAGDHEAAATQYHRALTLATNPAERRHLHARLSTLPTSPTPGASPAV